MCPNNTIDKYIVEYRKIFDSIPHYQTLQDSPDEKELFDSLIGKMMEINNLKHLYQNYLYPSAQKCRNEQRKLISKSKIILKNSDLRKEVLSEIDDIPYSIIRMGYVQLFHFIESSVKVLFEKIDLICEKNAYKSVSDYVLERHHIDIKKHWCTIDQDVEKINWISNRVKHDDGLPIYDINRLPIEYLLPDEFPFDKNQRIKLELTDFISDIDNGTSFLAQISNIAMKLYVVQILTSFINGVNIQHQAMKDVQKANEDLEEHLNKYFGLIKTIGIKETIPKKQIESKVRTMIDNDQELF
jgi:hypothetical protein